MLNCNIISQLYNILRKNQFGICSQTNKDTLLSMSLYQLREDMECSGAVLCYVPETCVGTTTTTCAITTSQSITTSSCNLITTQWLPFQ